MTNPFDKLIKALQRETIDLKTSRRRSSLTLETTTKSIVVQAQATTNGSGNATITKNGLVKIRFATDEPQLFHGALGPANEHDNWPIWLLQPYNEPDDAGIIVEPSIQYGLTPNTTYNINIKVYVTATGDFTLEADQLSA